MKTILFTFIICLTLNARAEQAPPVTTSEPKAQITYSALSEKERDILQRGEITDTRYIVGGILGTYPLGFGIGHAIQGRYSDTGWIFTVGEMGSLAVMMAGVGDCWSSGKSCSSGGLMFLGLLGYAGFKVWEIADLWAGPPEHNRRYRELKNRLGESSITFKPAFVPLADGGMLGLGVTF
jgi:hypothetical protein